MAMLNNQMVTHIYHITHIPYIHLTVDLPAFDFRLGEQISRARIEQLLMQGSLDLG